MPTPERIRQQPSMRELLASCAAANAVSTPPAEHLERAEGAEPEEQPDAERERDAA